MVENKMFETVNGLLEKYIGGQIFFTELDKAVKFNDEILDSLIIKASTKFPKAKTIASGKIGLAMHNLGVKIDLLVAGGLRFNPEKINLEPFADRIRNQEFIFVDDSYFSGKTAMVVKEEIERLGGKWLGCYVAYDGSKSKDKDVYALYRYYDYHDILGRKLEKTLDK